MQILIVDVHFFQDLRAFTEGVLCLAFVHFQRTMHMVKWACPKNIFK